MTLHEAVRHFRWSSGHDYRKYDTVNGQIVSIYGLGLYEDDLTRLKETVPSLEVTELRRVEHDHGAWLRVDVAEAP